MIKVSVPQNELVITFAKSGGPGGQNVNKVNTKVILHWNLSTSEVLRGDAKARFRELYVNYINEEGFVVVMSQESRSQKANIDGAIEKLQNMISKAMIVPKVRKKTKPKYGSVMDRLNTKKKDSAKKKGRSEKHY
ncbi:MAG: alternative ribosome rescue aminoacyl-tRNA hydrolase ArfB [Bacteriovoracaceae bacterium]